MSLRDLSGAPCLPVTAVAWTSNASTCPKDFTMINVTEDGGTANFVRGFGKSGYYLCYSSKTAGGMVVSDMQVTSEKEATPHGYCYIPEYLEAKASMWRKKRVCVCIVPLGTVETAVLDIKLTTKSKVVLQHYTCLGEVHGYVLWCKKGIFAGPVPRVKPRSISLEIKRLSLDQPAPPKPPKLSNSSRAPAVGKLSHRRSNLQSLHNVVNVCESINIHNISAIDGIPFALHPRFESPPDTMVPSATLNIRIKTVQDIENEYGYSFAVEEKVKSSDSLPKALTSSPLPQ
ncbi:hypothetical protein AAFF_G00199700 [Aldrovandia affinis]|uniref:Multivesicular body subunit 12A n=1 Tax=Aldrovandia affinis TaxID=143900 RepID=A0AAD7RHW8_9TELE|nr:hypothetical protein AAFF_G00199700 [Aldrovandia affinis]